MGEIAEMMLDGTLCQGCGVYIGNSGYPGYCDECAAQASGRRAARGERVPCPHCGQRVKAVGLRQHVAAKHVNTETADEVQQR